MFSLCLACKGIFSTAQAKTEHRHHQTLSELQHSASSQCLICTALWDAIMDTRRFADQEYNALDNEDQSLYPVSKYTMRSVDELTGMIGLRMSFNEKGYKSGGLWRSFGLLPLTGIDRCLITVQTERSCKGLVSDNKSIDSRYDHLRNNGQVMRNHPCFSMNVARGWLQHCQDHHEQCRAPTSWKTRRRPTRLLEIDKPSFDKIRLVENTPDLGADIRYATLSHCWGQSQGLRLTQTSKQHFETGIPVSNLSLTFRDAIEVCRSLGVAFIWIDALCIIQSSREDWLREAPRMMDTYSGSLFNIAATSAADSNAGCLPWKNRGTARPPVVQLKGTGFPDGLYVLYDHEYKEVSFNNVPLMKRGWVVQELLLATRVLHLCGTEMFWECSELDASEIHQSGLPPGIYENWMPRGTAHKALKSLREHSATAIICRDTVTWNDIVWDFWPKVVAKYSACGLTYASDKLAALSGIAGFIRHAFQVEYCAGLWKPDLGYQLLWTRHGPEFLHPPPTYRAPTWSWASMDDPVRLAEFPERDKWRLVARIHECHIETRAKDTTIDISHGFLRLSGWLVTMQIQRREKMGPQGRWSIFANGTWQKNPIYHIFLDDDFSTDQVHALPVLADTRNDQPAQLFCLLLRTTEGAKGSFYRIGVMVGLLETLGISGRDYSALGEVQNESWLQYESRDDAGLCTVVIV